MTDHHEAYPSQRTICWSTYTPSAQSPVPCPRPYRHTVSFYKVLPDHCQDISNFSNFSQSPASTLYEGCLKHLIYFQPSFSWGYRITLNCCCVKFVVYLQTFFPSWCCNINVTLKHRKFNNIQLSAWFNVLSRYTIVGSDLASEFITLNGKCIWCCCCCCCCCQ